MSWLSRTRQSWKLRAFLGGVLLAIGLFVGALAATPGSARFNLLLLVAAVAAAATLAWFFLSVRCPSCRGRAALALLREHKSSAWFAELIRLRACPLCGKEA